MIPPYICCRIFYVCQNHLLTFRILPDYIIYIYFSPYNRKNNKFLIYLCPHLLPPSQPQRIHLLSNLLPGAHGIDPRRLQGIMPQDICQRRDISALIDVCLSKKMAEGVGMRLCLVHPRPVGDLHKHLPHSAAGQDATFRSGEDSPLADISLSAVLH